MKETVDSSSVLAIKIDRLSTKVYFFDVVDERYHLIAASEATTTAAPPFNDVREGVTKAVDRIQQITGRRILDYDSNFIIPSQPDGSGIDHLVLTFGFFSEIKIISMGLLESVSLQVLSRLLSLTQLDHVDQISMNDPRKLEEIIAVFTNKLPDMVIISGGVDEYAVRSVIRQLEMLLFCIKLVPKEKRPFIVFAGDEDLEPSIRELVDELTRFDMTPRLKFSSRPENLNPAFLKVNKVSADIMRQKVGGLDGFSNYYASDPMPYSQAMIISTKFLSLLSENPSNSILAIDFGKESVSLTTGQGGNCTFDYAGYSLNHNFEKFLQEANIRQLESMAYLSMEEDEVRQYLWDKTIFPNSVPTTDNHLAIEKALISAIIQKQLEKASQKNPGAPTRFDQVIISGEVFTAFMSCPEALLAVLDGLLPSGLTSFYLDTHGVLPVLGAIAPSNRYLPVQLLEGSAIALMAKVLSIASPAKAGALLANIKLEFEDGGLSEIAVEQGMIYRLPLQAGQTVNLTIEPKNRLDLNPNIVSKGLTLQSGLCGIVIDARGRPFALPKEEIKRKDILKKWYAQLIN